MNKTKTSWSFGDGKVEGGEGERGVGGGWINEVDGWVDGMRELPWQGDLVNFIFGQLYCILDVVLMNTKSVVVCSLLLTILFFVLWYIINYFQEYGDLGP